MLSSFASYLWRGRSLDMTLDEVLLLLLEINFRSLEYIFFLFLIGIFFMHMTTTNSEVVACNRHRYGQLLEAVALLKASLSSV